MNTEPETDECCICFEDTADVVPGGMCQQQHFCCKECFAKHLEMNEGKSVACPLCRADLVLVEAEYESPVISSSEDDPDSDSDYS